MRRTPLLAAALLVASFGVAEGVWTDRWSAAPGAEQAAARLAGVPHTVGAWRSEDGELDERQVKLARLTGHVMRTYAHPDTKEVVTVLLVCGKPGPVAVHTPDVCFQGAGATMTAGPDRQAIVGGQFWAARFKPADGPPAQVLWAWTADGAWEAPDQPRVHFARSRALYKLYLIHPTARPAGQGRVVGEDPVLAGFAAEFLPAAGAALFPPETPPEAPRS